MPSRWWVPILGVDPQAVRREHVHAAVSGWFDQQPGEHGALTKAYAVSLPAHHGDAAGVEVGTLTDEASRRLTRSAAAGRPIRLGGAPARLGTVERLAHASWETLAQPSGARRWQIRFETPTTFRRGDRSSPLPVPATMLRGLTDTWNAWSGRGPVTLLRGQSDHVWVSDLEGRSVSLKISGVTLSGFVGLVVLRCGQPEVAGVVDSLLRMAEFSGLGSAKAKGMGVVRVEPDLPSRRRRAG